MEILIGREEGARRLHCVANGREFNLGAAGSVPTSVSRKHCKLIINGNQITIENIREQNITYVDGNQIFCKSISTDSNVQLGKDRYPLPLKELLAMVANRPNPSAVRQKKNVPTFSLAPLEAVWEDYDKRKMELQKKKEDQANKQRAMMGARMALGSIPIVGAFAGVAMGAKMIHSGLSSDKDSISVKLRELDEELDKNYVCPNPECQCPFGPVPYRRIKFRNKCPSCGCKYTSE